MTSCPEDVMAKENEANRKCHCVFQPKDTLLTSWELYKPRTSYVNTNISTKPSSTATIRRLLTERNPELETINGKPTALTRLIEMMQKPPQRPEYEYGNCLQQTLDFDPNTCTYRLAGKLEYTPPDIDEVFLGEIDTDKRIRRNPFKEVQICPTSLHRVRQQPMGQEYVKREDYLIDPTKL